MGSSEKEEGLSSEGENTKSCSDCKSSPKDDSISYEGLTEGAKKKCCSDCKTTKTPLWRSGPSGPKSLCNACGIRYRKKRPTVAVELKRGKIGKTKGLKIRNPFKVNLMIPLEEQTWYDVKKKQRSPRQWGEVERAALLLMALSCGAIFA